MTRLRPHNAGRHRGPRCQVHIASLAIVTRAGILGLAHSSLAALLGTAVGRHELLLVAGPVAGRAAAAGPDAVGIDDSMQRAAKVVDRTRIPGLALKSSVQRGGPLAVDANLTLEPVVNGPAARLDKEGMRACGGASEMRASLRAGHSH